MRTEGAGLSSVGKVRENNEDFFQILPMHDLYLLADGMGAHAAGEVASRMAVETIAHYLTDKEVTWPVDVKREAAPADRLAYAIRKANVRVFESARSESMWRDMGTTVVALQLAGDRIDIAHVGDSRAYRWRRGALECLTRDHSLAAESPEQFAKYAEVFGRQRLKNIVTRAIGVEHAVEIDTLEEQALVGDRYLLCSDGLTGMLEDAEIATLLTRNGGNLESLCQTLVASANERGGKDNITVILVGVVEQP